MRKLGAPVESLEYGRERPVLVDGPEFQGEQAVVEAGGVRVTVSPDYDGVWTWIRGPLGLTVRARMGADRSVDYHEDRPGCPDSFEACTATGEPAWIGPPRP